MYIGDGNVFKTKSSVSVSKSIGNNNVFMPFSTTLQKLVADNCRVGVRVALENMDILAENNTAIYTPGSISKSKPFHHELHEKQLDYLSSVLPKYH